MSADKKDFLKLGYEEMPLNKDAIANTERILIPCEEGLNNLLFSLYVQASQSKYNFKFEDGVWVLSSKKHRNSPWYQQHKDNIAAYIKDAYKTGHVFKFCVYDYDQWQTDATLKMGNDHPNYAPYVSSYNTVTVNDQLMHALPAKETMLLFDEQPDKTIYPQTVHVLTVNGKTYGRHIAEVFERFKGDIEAGEELPGDSMHFIVLNAINKRDMLCFEKEKEGGEWLLDGENDFGMEIFKEDAFKLKVNELLNCMQAYMVHSPFVNIAPDGDCILISMWYMGILLKDPTFDHMKFINHSIVLNPTKVTFLAIENVKLIGALFSLISN